MSDLDDLRARYGLAGPSSPEQQPVRQQPVQQPVPQSPAAYQTQPGGVPTGRPMSAYPAMDAPFQQPSAQAPVAGFTEQEVAQVSQLLNVSREEAVSILEARQRPQSGVRRQAPVVEAAADEHSFFINASPEPDAFDNAFDNDVEVENNDSAQTGVRGFLNRTLKLRLPKSRPEQIRQSQIDTINESTQATQVIGIMGAKGGVGKTSITQMLGSTLAQHRKSGLTVGVDLDSNATLAYRMKPSIRNRTRPSIVRLAREQQAFHSSSDIENYLWVNAESFAVLPGASSVEGEDPVTPAEFIDVLYKLHNFYKLILLDFPGSPETQISQVALNRIDYLVYVVENTSDSIWAAKRDLKRISKLHPELIANATVILNHRSGSKDRVVDIDKEVAALQSLSSSGAAGSGLRVFEVLHDPHVSAGGKLELSRTDEMTQARFLEIAAFVVEHLPKKPDPRFILVDRAASAGREGSATIGNVPTPPHLGGFE